MRPNNSSNCVSRVDRADAKYNPAFQRNKLMSDRYDECTNAAKAKANFHSKLISETNFITNSKYTCFTLASSSFDATTIHTAKFVLLTGFQE